MRITKKSDKRISITVFLSFFKLNCTVSRIEHSGLIPCKAAKAARFLRLGRRTFSSKISNGVEISSDVESRCFWPRFALALASLFSFGIHHSARFVNCLILVKFLLQIIPERKPVLLSRSAAARWKYEQLAAAMYIHFKLHVTNTLFF